MTPGAENRDHNPSRLSPDSPDFLHELRAALEIQNREESQTRVAEIINSLSPEDFPSAFLAAQKLENPGLFLDALAGPWGKIDPDGAASFGAEHQAPPNFFSEIGSAWAKSDRNGAMAWIEKIAPQPGHADLTFLIINVIGNLGQSDPRTALEFWDREKSYVAEWVRRDYMNDIYAQWAERNPQEAVRAALELQGEQRQGVLTSVAKAWATKDPKATLAWLDQLQNRITRTSLTHEIASVYAETNPAEAIKWAQDSQDLNVRKTVFVRAISALAATDVSAALEALQTLPNSKERDAAVSNAISSSIFKNVPDPDTAAQLLEQLPPGAERNRAASSICDARASSNPRTALDWLVSEATIPVGTPNATFADWLKKSANDALAWAQSLPAGENREGAYYSIAVTLAGSDPAQARLYFAQLTPEDQDQAAASMAKEFFNRDPAQARQWAESLPPGDGRNSALRRIAGEWYDVDPNGVTNWLNTMPSSPSRDKAVGAYCEHLAKKDPGAAMNFAISIQDNLDRSSEIEDVAKTWLQSDPAAAQKWINTSQSLSDAQKAHLLK